MNNPASTPLLFAYSIIYFLVLLMEISKVNANFAGLCYCGVFKIFFVVRADKSHVYFFLR